jgi:hypothetical protein
MHALRNVSSALRWRESEFTTSVPGHIHMSVNQSPSRDRQERTARTGFHKRSLQHIREQAKHGVKGLELRIRPSCKLAVLDAGEQLSEDGKVKDKWCSKQRVLAFVENVDSRATTAHDLRVVLVDSTL